MASKQNLTLLCVFSLLCFNVHQIYAIGAISAVWRSAKNMQKKV